MALILSLTLIGCEAEESTDPHMHESHDSPMHDSSMHDSPMHDSPMHDSRMHEKQMHSGDHHESSEGMEVPEDARRITITATDYDFDPAGVEAAPGEKLFIKLVNKGNTIHMWQLKGMSETHLHAEPGESASKLITAPEEPGDYHIFCGTKGHEQLGMVGTLSVKTEEAME